MFNKIIISKEEFLIKIPKELQGKVVEIYVLPVDSNKKISKKMKLEYFTNE